MQVKVVSGAHDNSSAMPRAYTATGCVDLLTEGRGCGNPQGAALSTDKLSATQHETKNRHQQKPNPQLTIKQLDQPSLDWWSIFTIDPEEDEEYLLPAGAHLFPLRGCESRTKKKKKKVKGKAKRDDARCKRRTHRQGKKEDPFDKTGIEGDGPTYYDCGVVASCDELSHYHWKKSTPAERRIAQKKAKEGGKERKTPAPILCATLASGFECVEPSHAHFGEHSTVTEEKHPITHHEEFKKPSFLQDLITGHAILDASIPPPRKRETLAPKKKASTTPVKKPLLKPKAVPTPPVEKPLPVPKEQKRLVAKEENVTIWIEKEAKKEVIQVESVPEPVIQPPQQCETTEAEEANLDTKETPWPAPPDTMNAFTTHNPNLDYGPDADWFEESPVANLPLLAVEEYEAELLGPDREADSAAIEPPVYATKSISTNVPVEVFRRKLVTINFKSEEYKTFFSKIFDYFVDSKVYRKNEEEVLRLKPAIYRQSRDIYTNRRNAGREIVVRPLILMDDVFNSILEMEIFEHLYDFAIRSAKLKQRAFGTTADNKALMLALVHTEYEHSGELSASDYKTFGFTILFFIQEIQNLKFTFDAGLPSMKDRAVLPLN
jgi:hypothetical protein